MCFQHVLVIAIVTKTKKAVEYENFFRQQECVWCMDISVVFFFSDALTCIICYW